MLNLLNEKQAALYLGLENHSTLTVWRSTGKNEIPYCKIGGAVRYKKDDLDNFISSNMQLNTGGKNV